MNLFTKWIIDNLDKVSLKLVADLRTFFHRFFDDGKVVSAVLKHTSIWSDDNGMSDRACQYLIKNKDSLSNFDENLSSGLSEAIKPVTTTNGGSEVK